MRQRQQKIVEHVQKVGIASYGELAEMFRVSTFTIRRDINYLAQARLLAKVKGGAQRIESPSHFSEASLPSRMQMNLDAKEKIAAKALEFVHPGDTIFLDGSSTITCFARAIAAIKPNITVVTNSILVALELSEAPTVRLVGLGGIFDRETFSYVGFDADAPAEAFFVHKAFFSCAGFVPAEGTFENAAFNRNIKLSIAKRSAKSYLLIDHSKFGRRALARVLSIDQIHTIVTNKIDPQYQQELAETETRLVLADEPPNNHEEDIAPAVPDDTDQLESPADSEPQNNIW
ncbi:MAG: DeoR/GlpR transcriptional regulator [Sedimentisphaerales bacterium]|nr:DeoR/GlpR transcriptional regulator [Sedimentisphaerales bacterium]